MLHKDYLLKQLHQLLDELKQRINTLKKSEIEDLDTTFNELYISYYSKERDFFLSSNFDSINELQFTEDQLSFLVELMLYDAEQNIDLKNILQNKALEILMKIDESSTTFSIERSQKIKRLQSEI